MRATLLEGLHITLYYQDRRQGRDKGKLGDDDGKKVEILVENSVDNQGVEERGFHLETVPKNAGRENARRYIVHLSRNNFEEIVDPERREYSFVSRCNLDRIIIKYYP